MVCDILELFDALEKFDSIFLLLVSMLQLRELMMVLDVRKEQHAVQLSLFILDFIELESQISVKDEQVRFFGCDA